MSAPKGDSMTRWLKFLWAVGALLLPTNALAAAMCGQATTGDGLGAGRGTLVSGTYSGRVRQTATLCLCDGAADCDGVLASNQSFGVYDLRAMGVSGSSLTKSPDLVIFERNLTTGCAGDLTATFLTGPDSSTLHTIGTPNAVSSATTRLVVDLQRAPLDRFLQVTLTNITSCTDSEILMIYGEVDR